MSGTNPVLDAARALGTRGLARCQEGDFDAGIAELREAVAMAPRDAGLHASLGTILFLDERLDEAQAVLRRALVLAPNHPVALANLSLVLRARGDFAAAERAARGALGARPDFPEARVNLGYALLAQGKFAEGWEALGTRENAQRNWRDPALAVTAVHDIVLPTAPAPIIVHGEQGLGDTLFFLRFANGLRQRGHRLAFWGDERLHSLLARTGLFEHFLQPASLPAAGLALLWAGDLPRLVAAAEPRAFPPPLRLATDAARVAALRARLASWGPPPYVGLTWRAGLAREGRVALSKSLDPALLGAALAGTPATFVSLQRGASGEELLAAAGALGVPLHDAGFVNDDLDNALAMGALLDEYVGVSNTNMHLRAGVGKIARVLVPYPPEWRWQEGVERSPWFPEWPLYRQAPGGDWREALDRLAGFTGR